MKKYVKLFEEFKSPRPKYKYDGDPDFEKQKQKYEKNKLKKDIYYIFVDEGHWEHYDKNDAGYSILPVYAIPFSIDDYDEDEINYFSKIREHFTTVAKVKFGQHDEDGDGRILKTVSGDKSIDHDDIRELFPTE